MVVRLPEHSVVRFEADGASWSLNFSVNALCRLEAEVGQEELEALLRGEATGVTEVRAAFWAGLRDFHPTLTLDDAGALVTHIGLELAGELTAQALVMAFPPAGEGGAADPRKASRRKRTSR